MHRVLRVLRAARPVNAENVARGVYGLILSASVIAAASESKGEVAGRIAAYTGMTLLIFWVAHVYAEVLARWIDTREAPTFAGGAKVLRSEWPMVSAGLPSLLILVIGGFVPSGTDRAAINLALGVLLVEIAVACGYAAHRAGARTRGVVLATGLGVAMAVVVILLKTLVK